VQAAAAAGAAQHAALGRPGCGAAAGSRSDARLTAGATAQNCLGAVVGRVGGGNVAPHGCQVRRTRHLRTAAHCHRAVCEQFLVAYFKMKFTRVYIYRENRALFEPRDHTNVKAESELLQTCKFFISML